MSAEIVRELVKAYKHEYLVYPFDFFESRVKEEVVRADLSNSGFAYIEIFFDGINSKGDRAIQENIWKIILEVISHVVRGSDVKGFLENDHGIGLILLDSNMQSVDRLRHRILARIKEENFGEYLKDESGKSFLQGFVYPDRITEEELEEDGSSLDP